MVIFSTEQVSSEVIKITSDLGLAFFIKTSFLKIIKPERIVPNSEFIGEEESDIVDAGMIYSVECKAVDYLGRSEQCRFGLTQKLINKKFEKKYIDEALDYLEEKNYLSDYRFAKSWLNSRKINHIEGRVKLLAELALRGISKDISNEALNEFFNDNPEETLCLLAYKKFIRNGKKDEKLIRSMLNAGFLYSMIKRIKTLNNDSNC